GQCSKRFSPDQNHRTGQEARSSQAQGRRRSGQAVRTRTISSSVGKSVELEKLEAVLNHRFKDRQLLERALTHRSSVYEKSPGEAATDNEQLEFLGDSILGFVVSD